MTHYRAALEKHHELAHRQRGDASRGALPHGGEVALLDDLAQQHEARAVKPQHLRAPAATADEQKGVTFDDDMPFSFDERRQAPKRFSHVDRLSPGKDAELATQPEHKVTSFAMSSTDNPSIRSGPELTTIREPKSTT